MTNKSRKIEIFSASCPICQDAIKQVKEAACPSCDIEVLDMSTAQAQTRAKELGINGVPAVAIDGKLANCCCNRGVDMEVLRAAGLGQPLG
ncbi:MAG: thioredoxin family protein [Hyphomicrobiaceae bacterium]